ncbi:MAG: transcriptional regulator [Clostridiales bacterium]|jgi:hypothetical protein|nr:transcriptional regulator [Clostridiales bacterium]
MCTDIFDNIISFNNSISEKAHDIPAALPDLQTMITRILYHIKENGKNIKGVLGSENGDVFMHYFKGYLSNQIGRFLFNSIPEEAFSIPKDFLLNHISGSFIEMVNWWAENNMKQTPEELTSYYIAVIDPLECIMIHSEDNKCFSSSSQKLL